MISIRHIASHQTVRRLRCVAARTLHTPEPPHTEKPGKGPPGPAQVVAHMLNTSDGEKTGTATPKTWLGVDVRVWAPAASTLLIGTGVGVIIPLLPMFARDMGITPSQFGLIVSAFGASRLLSNFPASWASERYGRRPFIVGGPFVSGAAMMGVAASSSFSELLLLRFLAGAGGAVFMGSGDSIYFRCNL